MKLKELIEKYEEYENGLFDFGAKIACQIFLKDLQQLDEPRPVKVKQFVADWIEVCKEHLTTSLYTAMNPDFMKENNQSFDFILWIKKTSNQETFARAWLDGYEVEEEPKYTVKIKSTKCSTNSLVFSESTGAWFFSVTTYHGVRFKHTRKQLEEADFGWVFDCDGVGVEEVE